MINRFLLVTSACLLFGCLPFPPAGLSPASAVDEPHAPFERFYSPAPHNFRSVRARDGAPVRRGKRAQRFELRHSDCGGSDCGNPRSRAEVQQTGDRDTASVGEEIWYGWSFFNESVPGFTRDDSLRLVFGQWTVGGDAAPAVRLIQLGEGEGNFQECSAAICTGPELVNGDVVVQLEDMRRVMGWGDNRNNGYICRLFDMAQNRGRWVDITMTTNFGQSPEGYLRVWVNGELKCDYRGPVISVKSLLEDASPEMRYGIFSSYNKRWKDAHPNRPRPTLVAYYDELRIGRSRADVDVALRENARKRPRD